MRVQCQQEFFKMTGVSVRLTEIDEKNSHRYFSRVGLRFGRLSVKQFLPFWPSKKSQSHN